MEDRFILRGTTPVPEPDLLAWARWFETADRLVARTRVSADVEVSTVFIGLNYARAGCAPLLFETVVFGGLHDGDMTRYSTWEEAQQGHAAQVQHAQVWSAV